MADLEELGLIRSRYLGGRIPTALGYGCSSTRCSRCARSDATEIRRLEGELGAAPDPQQLVESARSLLSQVTHMAGIVMLRARSRPAVRQIEFLNLSANRVLAILVTPRGAGGTTA